MWCELPTRFIRYTSVVRFSLPQVPLLASSDCDLGTFNAPPNFSHTFSLCNCTMTSGVVTCPWVFTCPFGSPLFGWACSIGISPTYQPDRVWWLWLLGPKRIINLVAYNSSMTPPHHQCSHTLLTIMSKNTEQLPCWDWSQRSNPEANLYETFDLTSASCDTSQRPFTQVCSKNCIRNLKSFW